MEEIYEINNLTYYPKFFKLIISKPFKLNNKHSEKTYLSYLLNITVLYYLLFSFIKIKEINISSSL
jgi:hypothetical protein